ncbi:4-hydroxy-tetrahydrodipicolinate reductase [Acidihalobacter prosperus]
MEKPKVGIVGASGRMGRALIESAHSYQSLELAAVVGRPGANYIGRDAGDLAGLGVLGLSVTDDLITSVPNLDVLIDFTLPESTLSSAEICSQNNCPMVVGTTGFSKDQLGHLEALSQRIAILIAPNMSLGVNLTLKLLEMAAKALGDDVDVEIIEAHHRHKIDAPSGTALQMGQVIAQALGSDLDSRAVYGRQGRTGPRERGAIGFEAIRAGDIVGEHTVMFAGQGERLEITHKASSRMTFAGGAMRAASWIVGQPAGLYGMNDVLGF